MIECLPRRMIVIAKRASFLKRPGDRRREHNLHFRKMGFDPR